MTKEEETEEEYDDCDDETYSNSIQSLFAIILLPASINNRTLLSNAT
mgnify:CR=1 FL=1